MTSIFLIQRLRSQRLSRVSRFYSSLPNASKKYTTVKANNHGGKRKVCKSLKLDKTTRRSACGLSFISLTVLTATLLRRQAQLERNQDLYYRQNAERSQTPYPPTFPKTKNHNHVENRNGGAKQNPTKYKGSSLQNLLATSSFATSKQLSSERNSVAERQLPFSIIKPEDRPSQEVDFIIVGYGNAGKAAATTLLEKCPECSILVIDPNLDIESSDLKVGGTKEVVGSVVALDHANQTIDFIGVKPSSSDDLRKRWNDESALTMKRIAYRESILLATGVRGAPPPESLIDNEAYQRILELRSTQPHLLNRFLNITIQGQDYSSFAPSLRSDVALSPEGVRQVTLMAASRGANIGILGSGLEALELAVACAKICKMQTTQQKHADETKKICLSFGSAAPLGNILPRYLSAAVSKRLRSFGVDIQERSLVRYVENRHKSNIRKDGLKDNTQSEGLEIHLVKSYDSLDTKRYKCDLLIVAPAVDGERGSASLPLITFDDIEPSILSHQSWAKCLPKKQRGVISCYVSDSRVMVNSELCAASGVYAAGSVAKYPNNDTGHTAVAGEGSIDAGLAGKIAAQNMIKSYFKGSGRHRLIKVYNGSFIAQNESLPLCRTDNLIGNDDISQSSLLTLGIFSLCIGDCDSETMSTHGFWWTNQTSPNRRLRRRLFKVSRNNGEKKKCTPIYGSGVVYYLDRSGAVKGVMLWGLPFTDSKNELNSDLIDRIKAIIRTDGEVVEEKHDELTKMIPAGLTSSHLLEESKFLASLAVKNGSSPFPISQERIQNVRPLYRYVAAKPISATRTGNLKRYELTGHGVTGEDIFDRSLHDLLLSNNRHPSLIQHEVEPNYLSAHGDGSSPVYIDKARSDNDYSARPSKEDTIWMRRNEHNKTTSHSEKMNEMFMQHIMKGHFQDGSDPVKQAPRRKAESE